MKAAVDLSDKNIEDCHGAGKGSQAIVKFCKKKMSKQVLNIWKNLQELSMENLQLTGQGKLHVN